MGLAHLGEFMLSRGQAERPGMCEIRQPMLEPRSVAGFPLSQGDECRGMLPRADREVNGEGARVSIAGSRDGEAALAKAYLHEMPGFSGSGIF